MSQSVPQKAHKDQGMNEGLVHGEKEIDDLFFGCFGSDFVSGGRERSDGQAESTPEEGQLPSQHLGTLLYSSTSEGGVGVGNKLSKYRKFVKLI